VLPQPEGVPVHETMLDHEQLAATQVALVVLAEQSAGVPVQLPPPVLQVHPGWVSHRVLLELLGQETGVPLQATVSKLHVQPVCV
jgi:hypothetical protein